MPGIVLWPGDPDRRIELALEEEPRQRVVRAVVRSDGSRWRAAGLGHGDGIDQVAARNGKTFTFWGFEWDYSGYVTDWGGGRLDTMPGGCTMSLRFSPETVAGTLPGGVIGERPVRSDDPAVARAKPVVSEVWIDWP